ncbi:complement C1q-like protein 2 [Siniperca chuatsi]|uniref:complement C1q-like protein 2 n=1 Tax=Siniperca chuatsi TaxID=119488 RepID=UPI001CE10A92|nr:complement C1q-like protein 2 [Siniperca chuatsi]
MMIVTVIFPLLLLVYSVSMDQSNTKAENEILAQPFPQDIHAVLREMTGSLVQLRVEMRFLQRENQANAAKLEELERQKTELDKLKQQLQVKHVAFSAALLAQGDATLGPFHTFTPLVFKHVVSNIGNAYNPNTGVFTPPVRGAYHFEWHIGAHGDGNHPTGAVLIKNSEHIFIAYEHQPTHYGTSSNSVTLLLEVGDVVFLRLWVNTRVYDNQNHHNTFSGHLLFTM